MKKLGLLACLVAITVLAGCAYGITPIPDGFFFSAVKYPSYHPAQDANPTGAKEGIASAAGFLGVFSSGDCSVEAAASNGGITKIKCVSHKTTKIFGGFYWKHDTIVRGD